MDDFDRAATRLKKEQQKRLDGEKTKRLLEAKKAEEAKKKIEAIEEAARLKRIEERAREEELQRKREEEELLTGGVEFKETYRAVATKEGGDRVTLPASALHALQFKGAMDQRGPMFFELTTREGGRTHCGVLEFTAEEGTIGLPPKVITCLAAVTEGDETLEGGFNTRVVARYVRLDKGRSVSLQPRTTAFATAMSSLKGPSKPSYDATRGKWVLPGVEGILHSAMQPLSSLTIGDIIHVPSVHPGEMSDGPGEGGGGYDLEVVALDPHTASRAVSLIDTDIEVVFTPSRADIDQLERSEAAARAAEARAAAWGALCDAAAGRVAARAEPPAGAEGVVAVALRLPSGGRIMRRFHRTDSIDTIYDWAAAAGLGRDWTPDPAAGGNPAAATAAAAGGGGWEGYFRVAAPYPRRVLAPASSESLESVGVAGPQEALVLQVGGG